MLWQRITLTLPEFRLVNPRAPGFTIEDYHFEQSSGAALVQETLGVLNLQGFGISKDHAALGCAAAIVNYAGRLGLAPKPLAYSGIFSSQALVMDPSTVRSLKSFVEQTTRARVASWMRWTRP